MLESSLPTPRTVFIVMKTALAEFKFAVETETDVDDTSDPRDSAALNGYAEGRNARREEILDMLAIASGVTIPALDDAVLTIPEVVRAVKRGDLSVKRHVPELPKPAVVATRAATTTSLAEVIRPDVKAKKNKRGAS